MARRQSENRRDQQEIHFRRSLFRFSIIFAVTLVAGLITRTFIERFPLEEKLKEAIKVSEPYELSINKPTICFSSGWIPVLGVNLQSLEIKDHSCPANHLTMQDTLVIISPLSLLRGKLSPQEASVDLLQVSHASECGVPEKPGTVLKDPIETPAEKKASGKSVSSDSKKIFTTQKIEKFFKEDLKKAEVFPLAKLKIERFRFNIIETLKDEISVEGEATLRKSKGLRLNANIKKIHFRHKPMDILSNRLEVHVDHEKAELEWKASVREGAIGLSLKVENREEFSTKADLQFNKVPVSAATDFLNDRMEIHYLWGSCHLELNAPWSQLPEKKITSHVCKLEGPYGEVLAENLDMSLSDVKRAHLVFKDLNLDEIVKNRRGLYLSGVLEKYGMLSGTLEVAEKKVKATGLLKDSELVFSKNNFRDIQKVKKIPFHFEGHSGEWEAEIKNVELEEGEFAGEVLLQRSEKGVTRGRVAFHKLKMNPKIYKLMFHAEPSQFQIYGQFEIEDGQLKDWSALLGTSLLASENYSLRNLKVKGQKKNHQESEVKVMVSEGEIDSDSVLMDFIRPTHLDQDWAGVKKKVAFRELSTKILIHKDRSLNWKRGYARLSNGWQLSSEGRRDSSRKVSAWLQWDRPDRRFMKWDFEGAFFEGVWKPVTPWVQSWLETNSDFLEKFKSVRPEGVTEPGLRQKALEKVKDVIRGVGKEGK